VKYASSASFRRALEDRLQVHSQKTALPLIRLRKLVAFDRLLARLTMEQPATWVLKGGLALQLRLGPQARTTQDVDLVMRLDPRHVHETLVNAAVRDLGDWFQFEIAQLVSTYCNLVFNHSTTRGVLRQ
jgi:nucleotidyltransferase AbiEii toxin of type IV toxin-antitoxin system